MNVSTKLVYQYDSYIKEYESTITRVQGDLVFLDETIFHPRSGGVEYDKGFLIVNGERVEVVEVFIDKETSEVAHRVSKSITTKPGTRVKMILDWGRRYRGSALI